MTLNIKFFVDNLLLLSFSIFDGVINDFINSQKLRRPSLNVDIFISNTSFNFNILSDVLMSFSEINSLK